MVGWVHRPTTPTSEFSALSRLSKLQMWSLHQLLTSLSCRPFQLNEEPICSSRGPVWTLLLAAPRKSAFWVSGSTMGRGGVKICARAVMPFCCFCSSYSDCKLSRRSMPKSEWVKQMHRFALAPHIQSGKEVNVLLQWTTWTHKRYSKSTMGPFERITQISGTLPEAIQLLDSKLEERRSLQRFRQQHDRTRTPMTEEFKSMASTSNDHSNYRFPLNMRYSLLCHPTYNRHR